MKELSKLQLCAYNIGGLLLVAGIIVPLFSGATAIALYLYLLGALMFSSMQILQKYEGKNITLKRLRRQQILGALMLLLAGGLMACSVYGIPPLCKGEWQVALAIGAVLEVYTAFRIPAELAREKR